MTNLELADQLMVQIKRVDELEAKLARYEQGVEVSGIIRRDGNCNCNVWEVHKVLEEIGVQRRVNVVVMKEDV